MDVDKGESKASSSKTSFSIKIVALGSAACRTLNAFLLNSSFPSEHCLALDTDMRCLESLETNIQTFCLSKKQFRGLGSGGDSLSVQTEIEQEINNLQEFFNSTDILFFIVSLGGGSGCGACLSIVQAAIQKGIRILTFPLFPFSFEGRDKTLRAQQVFQSLQLASNLVIPFYNDILFQCLPETATIKEAFREGDHWLSRLLNSLYTYFSNPTAEGLEEDSQTFIKYFFNKPKSVSWGIGVGDGESAAQQAIQAVHNCPFWTSHPQTGTQNVFMFVQTGDKVPLSELKHLNETFQHYDLEKSTSQFFTTYRENSTESQHIELFVLKTYYLQTPLLAHYNKSEKSNQKQIQFDFKTIDDENYWDTPTYLRLGLKLQ